MRRSIDTGAFATMVALCLVWGLQQVAIKAAATDIDPALQVGLRSVVAATMVWLLSRFVLRDRWLPRQRLAGLLVGGLFGLEFLLVAEGLRWTSAAHMAVFLYTAPIFAAIGLHLSLSQERLARVQWCGIAIAFGGIVSIFVAPEITSGGDALSGGMWLGDLLGLCAGAAWGMTTVAIRRIGLSEAPPAQTLFYQLGMAAVMTLAYAFLMDRLHVRGSTLVWVSLSFQTLIVSVVSFLIWFHLMRRYLASRLGVLSFMTPIFGVIFGACLLGETLEPSFLAGSSLVLTGMLIVNGREWMAQRKRRHHGRVDAENVQAGT